MANEQTIFDLNWRNCQFKSKIAMGNRERTNSLRYLRWAGTARPSDVKIGASCEGRRLPTIFIVCGDDKA